MTFIAYKEIPHGRCRDVTYIRLVTANRPFKEEIRRVRATVGGNHINYPFKVSTKTAEIQTAKLLFNSVISTPGVARFMTMDISDFYLTTKCMLRPSEYVHIPLKNIPENFIQQYNLCQIARDNHVYACIDSGMYGLPQAGN